MNVAEDAAEDDVVEHVRGCVRQVVGVGQRNLPDCPRQGDQSEQSGDAGDPGAGGDVGPLRSGGKGSGAVGCGHGQRAARGRCRPRAAPGPGPPHEEDGPRQHCQGDADEGDGRRMDRQDGAGDDELAVGRAQCDVDGQSVTRAASLGQEAHRGGRPVERQGLGRPVGKGELVAGQGDDHIDRVGRAGQHRDGNVGPPGGQRDGVLAGQRDLVGFRYKGAASTR